MTYYRLMLRDGTSTVADARTARCLIKARKVISIKEIGRNSPLYQYKVMAPAGQHVGYITK